MDDLVLDALPQRSPFRFLTTARRSTDGVEGVWRVDGSEPFFAGHFPASPIVPGVLIGEALAQLSGLLLAGDGLPTSIGLLVHIDLRFRAVVRPPATIQLRSRLDRTVGTLAEFEVAAHEGDRRVAEGRLVLRLGSVVGET